MLLLRDDNGGDGDGDDDGESDDDFFNKIPWWTYIIYWWHTIVCLRSNYRCSTCDPGYFHSQIFLHT